MQKASAPKQKNTRKVVYEPEPDDYEVMNEFFRIHDFSKVFYMSMLLDPLSNGSTASLNLFSVLSCAYQNHVSQFYICLPDQHQETSERRMIAGQNMLAALSVFNQAEGMKVRLIYAPYLLNKADPVTIDLSRRRGRDGYAGFPWKDNINVGFTDVNEFLSFLPALEDNVSQKKSFTLDADIIAHYQDGKLSGDALAPYLKPEKKKSRVKKKTAADSDSDILQRFILPVIVLIFGALLTEYLTGLFRKVPNLGSVDLRLIYIVLIAISGDSVAGILAGLLEAGIVFYEQVHTVMTVSEVLYNPDNWVIYILYICLGAGIAYIRRNQLEQAAYLERDRDRIQKDNNDLRLMYTQLMRKKNEYQQNLENSRNGFGRLYEAFTKLSSVEPQKIMAESISVMEKLLSNHSIAIYSIFQQNDRSARLQVASSSIFSRMPRSVWLSKHQEVIETLNRNEIWFNKNMVEGEPVYAAPVVSEGRLIAIIVVMEADFSQVSLYFQNLLFIISRLIGSLIVTAIAYQTNVHDQNYIEGTHIYRKDMLYKRMELLKQMKNDRISSYQTITISRGEQTIEELDRKLAGLVRPTDIVGQLDDDRVVLVAANTDKDSAGIVVNRLRNAGLNCQNEDMDL